MEQNLTVLVQFSCECHCRAGWCIFWRTISATDKQAKMDYGVAIWPPFYRGSSKTFRDDRDDVAMVPVKLEPLGVDQSITGVLNTVLV